jgi:hypothetical protein
VPRLPRAKRGQVPQNLMTLAKARSVPGDVVKCRFLKNNGADCSKEYAGLPGQPKFSPFK